MRRAKRIKRPKNNEQGVVVLLVAAFLLFVVAAMAALSIDLATFYTARSEAQLAADGAALAAARVMANSGMTTVPSNSNVVLGAQAQATAIAKQVGQNNPVGGRNLTPTEISVSFPPSPDNNPQVKVLVSRNDLPTFFARIWGRSQQAVSASATAEAYNPSSPNLSANTSPPLALTCAKPWLLPNMNPGPNSATIPTLFDPTTGMISDASILGSTFPLRSRCQNNCFPNWPAPSAFRYYPGNQPSFPKPTSALQACSAGFNDYQLSVAGCVQVPIACGVNGNVNLDHINYSNRNSDTVAAVNCLSHAAPNNKGDSVEHFPPTEAFGFEGGDDNPIPNARGKDIMVSNSLVTVPVFDSTTFGASTTTVQVIGFVQLFVNPTGQATAPGNNPIQTTIVNMAGCGTASSGQAILGNGASAIPVRLITPQ